MLTVLRLVFTLFDLFTRMLLLLFDNFRSMYADESLSSLDDDLSLSSLEDVSLSLDLFRQLFFSFELTKDVWSLTLLVECSFGG